MRAAIDREDGIALITGILVSAIVLILSTSAVAISIHNTEESSYDKRRLMTINAAEGGVDYYYQLLGSTSFTNLPSATTASTCVLTRTLSTSPSVTFTVTPAFYNSSVVSGTGSACPTTAFLASNPSGPWYVKLTSRSTAAGPGAPVRTMESKARLSLAGTSTVFPPAAILGDSSVDLSANIEVLGNGANNADVYSNGNLSVSTQSNLKGNLYVQGNATVANGNFQLSGDLWASSWVNISGGKIGGSVISSGSTTTTCPSGSSASSASICVSGNTYVYGGAKAGGAIGLKSPATISGTQSPNTSGIGSPPSATYPTYSYNAADWSGVVTETSCTNAQNDIANWTTGNLYIRLNSTCLLNPMPLGTNKTLTSSQGNLAILTNGGVTFETNTKLTATSGTHNVYIFTGMSGTCGDFLSKANSGVGSNIKVLLFTPQTCLTTISSNSWNASGQIFSGTVRFSSNATLTYAPVDLPAKTAADSAGYLVDPVYKREIVST